MFKTNTLFILGAGASYPYGFPLGKGLIKDILENMEDHIFIPDYLHTGSPFFNLNELQNNVLYDFKKIKSEFDTSKKRYEQLESESLSELSSKGIYRYDYFDHVGLPFFKRLLLTKIARIDIFNALERALIDFDPISIDAFLRDNPKYALAGKIMIVYSLLKKEDPSKFTINSGNKDNWYSLLLNDLVSQCAGEPTKILENNLKITTFNYDVSLDFFLHSRLKNIEVFTKADVQPSLAEKFLNTLTIKHIYGQTDKSYGSESFGKYFHDVNSPKPFERLICHFKRFLYGIYNCDNIKTMYDERRNSSDLVREIESNRNDIEWAEDVIIIGFGFDRDNLDLLGFPNSIDKLCNLFKGKTIRFLNYGGEMSSLSNEFKEILEESAKRFGIEHRGKADKPEFKLIESKAATKEINGFTVGAISSAYLNDFKKYLLK